MLDLLSQGRAVLSVGRGYDAREYAAFGVDFSQSLEIFFEGLDIVQKAWTQDRFSHDGKYYQFPECSITPRPVQQPHPPIYVACVSEPTLRRAARAGSTPGSQNSTEICVRSGSSGCTEVQISLPAPSPSSVRET